MDILVKDIAKFIEEMAPIGLKEDYDNVGLMVGDKNQKVNKVLLALDCTKDVIEEAKANNVDLIISHHPLLFRRPNKIVKGDLQGDKIIELIKNNISLYSCHTNLDSARDGINEEIVKLLGFTNSTIIEKSKTNIEGCGIGRLVKLNEEIDVNELITIVKEKLGIKNLRVAIGKEKVSKIAIINGSGQDFFAKSLRLGADCIITGDTSYHFVSDYKEMGVTILDPGHFPTEWITFLNVMKKVEDKFDVIEFISSKTNKDPYEFK